MPSATSAKPQRRNSATPSAVASNSEAAETRAACVIPLESVNSDEENVVKLCSAFRTLHAEMPRLLSGAVEARC